MPAETADVRLPVRGGVVVEEFKCLFDFFPVVFRREEDRIAGWGNKVELILPGIVPALCQRVQG